MVSPKVFLLASVLASSASCILTLDLKAQPLNGGKDLILGSLLYDQEQQHAELINVPESKVQDGQYCIGPVQNGEFECQSVAHLTIPFRYKLNVNVKNNGDLRSLSLVRSENNGIIPVINRPQPGAQPILKKPPKPVVDEHAGAIINQEEEAPKSFIQQYWMYIVPILILLMLGQSDQQQQGRQAARD